MRKWDSFGVHQRAGTQACGRPRLLRLDDGVDHRLDTRVGRGGYFDGKILGSNFCVSADGTVLDSSHTDIGWLFADARSDDLSLTDEQNEILALARRAA